MIVSNLLATLRCNGGFCFLHIKQMKRSREMQKFFKLSTVSLLAIITANGARAAGYTCEELIEYTSCNTGYALLEGDCVCDGGYYTNGDKCTICPIGTYSSVNASECTTCPTTGLVDPDNKAIVATTASTGSKNISACIIPTNVTIKGPTGQYHFKSSCAYNSGANTPVQSEQDVCESNEGRNWDVDEQQCFCEDDGMWAYDAGTGYGTCMSEPDLYDQFTTCTENTDGLGSWDFGNNECVCPDGYAAELSGFEWSCVKVTAEYNACLSDEYATWQGDTCACDGEGAYRWIYSDSQGAGACVNVDEGRPFEDCSAAGYSWNYSAGTCACPSGQSYSYDGESWVCE